MVRVDSGLDTATRVEAGSTLSSRQCPAASDPSVELTRLLSDPSVEASSVFAPTAQCADVVLAPVTCTGAHKRAAVPAPSGQPARMADDAQPSCPSPALPQLPPSLWQVILLQLPADARARFATVCRAFRFVASEPAIWAEVDLTPAGGVACLGSNPSKALRCLAPRLAQTRVLRLPRAYSTRGQPRDTTWADVMQTLSALARDSRLPALRELRLDGSINADERGMEALRALLAAAGQLTRLEVAMLRAGCDDVAAVLTLPRLHATAVSFGHVALADTETLEAVCAALQEHEALRECVATTVRGHVLGQFVDVAIARRLTAVGLRRVVGPLDALFHIQRLVRDSAALRRLSLSFASGVHAGTVQVLAAALRGNSTLQELEWEDGDLWLSQHVDVGVALCAALEGHESLTTLSFYVRRSNPAFVHWAALDASLAAVLAAARELKSLTLHVSVDGSGLPDGAAKCAALPLLFDAVAQNRYLRTLDLDVPVRPAFLRDVALPALRANVSLRRLELSCGNVPLVEVQEARELVQQAQREFEARAGAGAGGP